MMQNMWRCVNKCPNFTSPGQPCVVGSLQPIVATSGDNVVLPCHLEPSWNGEEAVVEWSRLDPSHVQYVHVYRDHGEVTDMKTASYHRRTALFTEELKHGNISLKIIEVTPADEGSYRCFIPTLRSPVKASTVQLIISECVLCEDGRRLTAMEAAVLSGSFSVAEKPLWILEIFCPGHHVCSGFLLEPNLGSATEFPRVPPTVDPESTTTDEGLAARGRAHLAAVVPFALVPVIAGAALFWRFCRRNT